jgi:pyrimidine operon attenuation protein/uracil phosphoribosyltransferase
MLCGLQRIFRCGIIARLSIALKITQRHMQMTKKNEAKIIMTGAEMDLALARIAAEIIEKLSPCDEFAIIGIRRRGVHLADRLCRKMEAILKKPVLSGILDITLYRDDLTTIAQRPMLRETSIEFDINNLSLVLADDVLYTGRTVRAALDGLVDLGRPKRVQLAVLIDRGHRELPIQADYVGKRVQTADDEIVEVRMNEEDGEERVVLVKKPSNHEDLP